MIPKNAFSAFVVQSSSLQKLITIFRMVMASCFFSDLASSSKFSKRLLKTTIWTASIFSNLNKIYYFEPMK